MNYHFFRDLVESPNILQETYLIDPTPCSAFDCYLQAGAVVAASRKANCKLGEINTGTYIWVVDVPTMEPKLCTVVFFWILICLHTYIRVLCSPLVYHGDNKWHGRTVVEPVSAMLSRAVVHVGSDGFVHARP